MHPVYNIPAGDILPVFFSTFAGSTGASVTLTGLAVTDIEIYKDVSMTQRASDAGYALIDTDGIDVDGITGIHGFSIDTGDNTDAGFYTVGAWFTVVVSAVTVDAQTVNFVAAQFRLMAAEAVAAKPKVDVDAWLGTAAATPTVAGVPEVDVTHYGGTGGTFAAGIPAVNADQISGDQAAAAALEVAFDGTAGPVPELGIVDQGTAQSASSTGLVLRSAAAFADDTLIGALLMVFGSTQGYWQSRYITDNALSGDTVTVDAWTVTPSGTITYKIFTSAPINVPTAVQIRTEIDSNSTQLAAILADTAEIGTAGAGLTNINLPNQTMDIVGNITGNLSGSVGSVSGAVASVTGNVGGNVTGSVGSVATGGITAASIADNAIDAGAIAADAITNAKIADGAISAGKLATDTITAAKIATDAITAAKIADGAIDAATFAAGAINAAAIASDAITDAKVASDVTIASVTGAVGSVTGNVGGSVASVASGGITAASFAADAITAAKIAADVTTELQSGLATASALATVSGKIDAVDTVVDAIKVTTDKLDDTLEDDAGTFRFTENALEEAPSGTGASAASIVAAMFTTDTGETEADAVAGSVVFEIVQNAGGGGGGLDAAGVRAAVGLASANLDTQLGAIKSETAAIVDDTGTSGVVLVNDAITNAKIAADAIGSSELAATAASEIAAAVRTELATELARVDAAVSTRATPAQVNAEADQALADYDAPTNAEMVARTLAAASYATAVALSTVDGKVDTVDSVADSIKVDTAAILVDTGTTLDARLPAALIGGRMDSSVGAMAAGVVTAAAVGTGAIDADALAADAGTEIAAAVLAAATANPIDANVQEVNDVPLTGDGNITPWGPA